VNRLLKVLVWGRIPLLLLVLLSLGPAAEKLPLLKTNNTIDTFLAKNDPGLLFYRETTGIFGGDNLIYVAMDSGGIFTVQIMGLLDRLADTISAMDGVRKVTNLASTDAVLDDEGVVNVAPLMTSPPKTAEEVARVKGQVRSSPLLRRLKSKDDRSALMIVELDRELLTDPYKQNLIVARVRDKLAKEQEGTKLSFKLAGNPVIAEAIERYNTRDQKIFANLMLALVSLASLILLRRFSALTLPGVVVLVTVIWIMGAFVHTGNETNWVTSILTPILFLVGVADVVHFLSRFQVAMSTSETRREAAVKALREIFLPCLLTSLTTAAGFASLMANEVMPVKVFGIFAAAGVVMALVATLAIVPGVLSFGGKWGTGKPLPGQGALRFLGAVDSMVQRNPLAVLLVAGVLTVGIAVGIYRMRVETNLLKYFKQDAPVVMDSHYIETAYGGSSPLDIVVDTGRKDGASDPKLLAAVDKFQDGLARTKGIERGVSLADLIKELHMVATGEKQNFSVPDSKAAVAQLLLLPGPKTLEPMVDTERRLLRISTRFQGARLGLQGARKLLDGVEAQLSALLPKNVKARLTGSSVLFINMDRYLVMGQIHSFGIVLAVLAVVMVLLFWSLRLGLLAMIPNLMPIGVMLGLMGWLDLPLDGFTVMIACIAIGIGVDDTIHYLHHLRGRLRAGDELSAAMTSTTRGVGRALVFTSVMLTLGFWIFCLSDFVGTRNFGLLTGITVMVALAADLLVLPAVLKLLGVPRGWGAPKDA